MKILETDKKSTTEKVPNKGFSLKVLGWNLWKKRK